jgi:hypothetical protein
MRGDKNVTNEWKASEDGGALWVIKYVYVDGNPLSRVDILGLDWVDNNDGTGYQPAPVPWDGFGQYCGSGASAYWIPDITPGACKRHDECYEQCKNSIVHKIWCDIKLGVVNPPYGLAVLGFGWGPYNTAQNSPPCNTQQTHCSTPP